MRLHTKALQVSLVTFLTAAFAEAQKPDPITLPRLTGPVVIDGVLDDEAWKQIPALPLTMYAPVFRSEGPAPPSSRAKRGTCFSRI